MKSLTRAKYNYETLDSALKVHRLPKGLSPAKIPLNIPDVSTEIQLQWEKAHIDLNKTLTELLRKHWDVRKTSLLKEYEQSLDNIRKSSSPGVLNHILKLLDQYQSETSAELHERTKKKMASTRKVDKKEKRNNDESGGKEPSREPVEPGTDEVST